MKYGQTLRAQSAPQWAPFNVDYDELKNIIKAHTTSSQCQAITIPGQVDVLFQRFEKLFYEELSNQHDRVDLFVKSKVVEINCRLQNLQKQVFKLISKSAEDVNRKEGLTLRNREKFLRYEKRIERCGEDIRSLKKFIAAQRVAFHKILKKYTKWTSSRTLADIFCEQVLGNPKSFVRRDVDPLISQYSILLRSLRAAVPDVVKFKDHDSPQPVLQQNFTKTQTESQPQYSYWNEYDNDSEVEEEPYLVYIDPNSESFPGSKTLANMFTKAKRPVKKFRGWLAPVVSSEEQRSLLHENDRVHEYETTEDLEGNIEDYASSSDVPNGYSTFYTTTILNVKEQMLNSKRDSFLLHTVIGCYTASLTLLLIAWLLATTGKKKLQMEVDAGVAIGVIASLMFAIIGVFLVHYCRQRLSKTYQYYAFVIFIFIFFQNSMLLVRMIGVT